MWRCYRDPFFLFSVRIKSIAKQGLPTDPLRYKNILPIIIMEFFHAINHINKKYKTLTIQKVLKSNFRKFMHERKFKV